MQPSLRLGRLGGIEIGIHYTWLLIAVLLTGSFFGYFSNTYPHWSLRTTWSAAIVISVLFFGSIILHEMAHALVAKAYGMQVRTITLFALAFIFVSTHYIGDCPMPLSNKSLNVRNRTDEGLFIP